jgi:hypothetical protein
VRDEPALDAKAILLCAAVGRNGTKVWRSQERFINNISVFPYNNRNDGENKVSDSTRFARAMSQVAGRRLTYSELTGKDGSPRHAPTRAWETPKYVPF